MTPDYLNTFEATLVTVLITASFIWLWKRGAAALRKEPDVRPVGQPLSSVARAVRSEDRRLLSERLRADVEERRHLAAIGLVEVPNASGTCREFKPIRPAVGARQQSAPPQVGLDGNSCFSTTTLTAPAGLRRPGDSAA